VQVSHDGGTVWVRASDAPGLALAGLPDLTPPTPAPVVSQPPASPALPPIVQAAPAVEPAQDHTHERQHDEPAPPTPVLRRVVR
jgi:hypothetical protein